MAIVLVDGWPTDKVEEASRLARESGINIFFITVEAAAENEKQHVMEPSFANKVCKCQRLPQSQAALYSEKLCCHQGVLLGLQMCVKPASR